MNRLLSLLPIATLLVVAGCKPEAEPVNAQPVGSAEAQPVGSALSASVSESAGRYSPAAAGFSAECTVTYVGDDTDVDGDGIPDNENSVTASNCESERGNAIANASYSVDDTSVEAVNPALYPFNFTLSGHWDIAGDDGAGVEVAVAADRLISGNQDATSIGGADSASVSAEITAPNAHFSSDESYAWDTTYTQTGALFGDGTITLNGEWDVEMEAEQGEDSASVYANATVNSAGLELSSTCATHIVGGVLTASYDASARYNEEEGTVEADLTVTFSGCGIHTVNYSDNASQTPDS